MTYETLAVLLMVVGFALIVAEVFIPSGGMILILCVVTFVASVWSAHKAWWGPHTGLFWAFVVALIVLIPSAVVGAFRLLEHSPMGRRILLTAPTPEEIVPHREKTSQLEALIGQRGQALTLMTPGGMVSVRGQRLHAESEGLLIDPETPIEVIGVKGTRVLVRAVDAVTEAHGAASTDVADVRPATSSLADQSPAVAVDPATPLDFDFPQG